MNYRVDHTLTDKQRVFVRYSRNDRREYRGNWIGEINGIKPIGNYLFRINDAINADHVWTMTNSSLLNVRASWSRFKEPSQRQHQGIFDPASLGFPSSTTQYFRQQQCFPLFDLDQYADIGQNFRWRSNSSIWSFSRRGRHARPTRSRRVRFRITTTSSFPTCSAGSYVFNRGAVLTRQLDNHQPPPSARICGTRLAIRAGTIDRSADRFNRCSTTACSSRTTGR
jgi:hypothetical protein